MSIKPQSQSFWTLLVFLSSEFFPFFFPITSIWWCIPCTTLVRHHFLGKPTWQVSAAGRHHCPLQSLEAAHSGIFRNIFPLCTYFSDNSTPWICSFLNVQSQEAELGVTKYVGSAWPAVGTSPLDLLGVGSWMASVYSFGIFSYLTLSLEVLRISPLIIQFHRNETPAWVSVHQMLNYILTIERMREDIIIKKCKCSMYLFQRRKTRVLEFINKSAQSLFLKIHWNKSLKNI